MFKSSTRRFDANPGRPRLALLPLLLAGLSGAPGVHAEPNPSRADGAIAAEGGEVVVVTGARGLARTVSSSMAPIDVVGEQELARTGKQNLRDALAALYPSYSNTPGFKGQTGIPVATATLRGLDANSVLILVNGKRRHKTALVIAGQSPTDLDLIPTIAVERIEVLRDGAAAQYGSDAISGVINIILKTDAEGGAASYLYGQYGSSVGDFDGRGKTNTLLLNQGFKLGSEGGFINLSATGDAHRGTNNQGPIPAATKIYFGNDPRETTLSRYRMIMGKPVGETYNLSYNAELPLSENTRLYSYSTLGKRDSQGWGYYRPANSPQNFVDVYPDGYVPEFVTRENDYQGVIGAKGSGLLGWNWDASTSYGRDQAKIYTNNTLNGSLGPAYQNQHDFYDGSLVASEWVSNLDINRSVATGWFDKPLSVSAGYEHRHDIFQQTGGEWASYANGGYTFTSGPLKGQRPNAGASGMGGFAPSVVGSYARSNDSLYADFSQSLSARWSAALAARLERYDDFGSVKTGKLSSRYEVSDALAFRGTVSNGFSAPTLQQQYYTTEISSYTTDPLTGLLRQSVALTAASTSVAAKALGARALEPQRSVNYSVGLVLKPAAKTNLTLDLYQIDVRNRILITPTLQGSAVSALLANAGLDPARYTSVAYYTNAAHTRTRGLDLVLDHRTTLPEGWGGIKWVLTSSQNETSIRQLAGIPAVLANSGIGYNRATSSALTDNYPKNITALSALWNIGKVELNLKETHYSSVGNASAVAAARDEKVDAAFITDLNLSYRIARGAKLTVGANNLFGKRPNQLTADAKKYFAIPVSSPSYSWQSPYGIDGAYYYARLDINW